MADEYPNRLELTHLVLNLSELLDTAIRTKGEMYSRDWERMEKVQRKAHAIKHPETLSRAEVEAVVRRRDAAPDLLEVARLAAKIKTLREKRRQLSEEEEERQSFALYVDTTEAERKLWETVDAAIAKAEGKHD